MQGWDFVEPELYMRLVQDGEGPSRHLQCMPVSAGSSIVMPCLDVPVQDECGHWTLLTIAFPPRLHSDCHVPRATVYHFDSMGNPPTDLHHLALAKLREQFADVRRVPEHLLWTPGEITAMASSRLQVGVIDCGIWVMAVARGLLTGDPSFIPRTLHMPGLRVLLAADQLAGTRLPVTYYESYFLASAWRKGLAGLVPLALPSEVCTHLPSSHEFCTPAPDISARTHGHNPTSNS